MPYSPLALKTLKRPFKVDPLITRYEKVNAELYQKRKEEKKARSFIWNK